MGSYYRDVYKLAGTRPMFQSGKIRKSPMRRGLYSLDEVTDLIVNQNYIPVATAAELDALRAATTQTMGAGTIWEGEYLTGLDKKYVQVDDIDAILIFTSRINSFAGTYDGNELRIDCNSALFRDIGATFNNIRVHGGSIYDGRYKLSTKSNSAIKETFVNNCIAYSDNLSFLDVISAGLYGVSQSEHKTYINNSGFIGNLTNTENRNGGLIGSVTDGGCEIKNCFVIGDISGNERTGGLVGECSNTTIEDSYFIGVVTATGNASGGLVGELLLASGVERCYSSGELNISNGLLACGGLIGFVNNSTLNNENNHSSVAVSAGNSQRIGGLIGWQRGSNSTVNSFSIGSVVGTGANTGGLVGQNDSTITNSYYDSQTSGQSDTGKGLPRTTEQMQQGTADSFILPAGGEDTGEDAANAMYTGWSVAIWKFTPLDKYPTLL